MMPSPAPAPDRTATPVVATRSAVPHDPFPIGTQIGRWRICRLLGEGATGRVYEVEHQALGTRRALKILSWAHPVLRARLLAEGRAQATLLHPNVVPVLDMMSVGDVPALLMELVDGPTLEDWLHEHVPTTEEAERIFRGILAGVETAHGAGLIHRDLKPANVIMAKIGEVWVPKVTDFGLAKTGQSVLGLTQTGMTMGTPGFMAPEQIRDPRDVDERADIFSLGCILYQLLTGKLPHEGPDPLAILNAVAQGSVTPVGESAPGLPTRLADAVAAAMAVDREARPADCAALRSLLDQVGEAAVPPAVAPPAASSTPWRSWLALSVTMAAIGLGSVCISVGIAAQGMAREPAAPVEQAPPPSDRFPAHASIVIPEPWVPDDVDPSLVIPEPPGPSQAEVPPPSPVVDTPAVEPPVVAAAPPCSRGWVRLPWLARSPSEGEWEIRKVRRLFSDPMDLAPLCEIADGSEVIVVQEAIRTEEGRFVEVVVR